RDFHVTGVQTCALPICYTYTDTEFVSTASAAGAEFYTPEHMFQLWTKYTFDERHGILDKAFIGGGVKVFSSFRNLSRTAAGGIRSEEHTSELQSRENLV